MADEPLNQIQLGHLRMYHAASLFANAVPVVMFCFWLHYSSTLTSGINGLNN